MHQDYRLPQQGGLKGSLPYALVRGEEVGLSIARQVFGQKVAAAARKAGGGSSPTTTKGDLFGHSTVDDRIPVGADGTVLTADSAAALGVSYKPAALASAYPGTLSDLCMWWESDDLLGTNGKPIFQLKDRTPWNANLLGTGFSGAQPFITNAGINGLPIMDYAGVSPDGFALASPFKVGAQCTVFLVAKPNVNSANNAIIGGLTGCLALYLNLSGANNLVLIVGSTAVIGTATTAWVANTPFQANVTFDTVGNTYQFRMGGVNAGNGAAGGINMNGATKWIGADGTSNTATPLGNAFGLLAVVARKCSPTEITNMESYIFNKWGV